MGKRSKTKLAERNDVGFIACYEGHEVAHAASLQELSNRVKVKQLMGKKGLVIKHNVPEGLFAVY